MLGSVSTFSPATRTRVLAPAVAACALLFLTSCSAPTSAGSVSPGLPVGFERADPPTDATLAALDAGDGDLRIVTWAGESCQPTVTESSVIDGRPGVTLVHPESDACDTDVTAYTHTLPDLLAAADDLEGVTITDGDTGGSAVVALEAY